ncbi:hypothetical protein AUJ46_06445 [Candidatus Peregrinibacteria bacterium CG1_02_54_53]|nr:MAG: hypothetical protein AUJ46_06445 [Candidatus Peregrinibacteria bacterium CG1_02_54_53]
MYLCAENFRGEAINRSSECGVSLVGSTEIDVVVLVLESMQYSECSIQGSYSCILHTDPYILFRREWNNTDHPRIQKRHPVQ